MGGWKDGWDAVATCHHDVYLNLCPGPLLRVIPLLSSLISFQVFVEEEDMPGRYRLIKESPSRPQGGEVARQP